MPVGLMVVGEHSEDHRLIAVARGVEAAIGASEQ
jgi:Asp-tRNA(Asn)/Glu-tRNA(Gln) amidotransferase A subunit family amidase